MNYFKDTIWAAKGVELFLTIVMLVVVVIYMVALSYKIMQMLQLSGYRTREFKTWYKTGGYTVLYRYFFLSFLITLGMAVYTAGFGGFFGWRFLGFGFFVVFSSLFIKLAHSGDKTPLRCTARVVRLHITTAVLFVIVIALVSLIPTGILGYVHLGLLPIVAIIPVVLMSNTINYPLEKIISNKFIKKAKAKLATKKDLKIVGITGSFGKTTAKNILHALLATKYQVCSSPASYNTPLGITRTVNDNLNDSHQVLILEMGARYKGDIKQLVDISNPQLCIITSVGNMHIDTMGSLQGVLDTKFEIASNLDSKGVLILDGINDAIRDRGRAIPQAICVGRESDWISFGNTSVGASGTEFDLVIGDKTFHMSTALLGRHIPQLVALCVAAAIKLGVDNIADMQKVIEDIPPVPHRLQLLPTSTSDNIIIDDAYNSNLIGATNALEVLSHFDNLKKAIVTPGIIQQGVQEQDINFDLGIEIAKTCDYAILIGSRAATIQSGIASIPSQTKTITAESLQQATNELQKIQDKKAILFENDLPDNYK